MSFVRMHRHLQSLIAALAVASLAACSSPSKPKPQEYEAIASAVKTSVAWTSHVGKVSFPLAVAVTAGVFTVADDDGSVVALQADTGRELWRGSVGSRLSAGVGSDGRYAAVVTREGEVVALEAGRVLWKKPLDRGVVTAPFVAGERVFVLAVDRTVHAFDAQTGSKLWTSSRPGDPLTLAQAGVITAVGDTLVVGQGPRLAGLDPTTGNVRWEVPIATPRGTNEVERLADLVAPYARQGDVICARAFQAAVSCADARTGISRWSRVGGGTEGVALDGQRVFGADATDKVTAWRYDNGEVAWSSDALMYRSLSAPAVLGNAVALGDEAGTVHFLSRDNGKTIARVATDGSAVNAAPVVAGNTLLIVTRNGGMNAIRLE